MKNFDEYLLSQKEDVLRRRAQKDPMWWIKNILGVKKLWTMQEQIINDFILHDKFTVSSGHALGKDYLGAILSLYFLYCYPPSMVVTTAPCFDKETEILTKAGWKKIKHLEKDDEVGIMKEDKLVYEKPLEIHKYKFKGELLGHKSRDIDFMVTPNHKSYVKKNWFKSQFEKIETNKIYGKWFTAFNREVIWDGIEDEWSEKHYELWGFWFTDGYCRLGGKERRCDVTITQKNFTDYTRELLKIYDKNVSEYLREDGSVNFAIYDKNIATWFMENFMPNGNKQIPQFVKMATKQKLKAFLRGVIMGDGDKGNDGTQRIRVYGDEKFANDLQEICIKAGYVSNLHKRNLAKRESILKDGRTIFGKETIEYSVSILSDRKKFPRARKLAWYKQNYDDYVYCVTISSGIVLVRRNGIYQWSGNSDRQVEKVVWREIEKLWHGAKVPLGGRLMSKEIRIEDSDGKGNDSLCIGFTTKETNQSVGKFQGLHAPNVFVMMTEAQAIDDVIFEQVESLLVTENSKLYLAGNPLRCEGEFYKSFEDKSFKKYIFSCYDCPNVKSAKDVIPGMVSRKWVVDKEERWGKESPQFQSRVMGQFPKQATTSLISLASLREAVDIKTPKGTRILGVDPARFGADETAFVLMDGSNILLVDGHRGKATTETQGKIINIIKKTKPKYVVIDEGAMGGGIIDHLELQIPILKTQGIDVELVPFKFNGRASDGNFFNLGTEQYFRICGMIEQNKICMLDDSYLISQLASRRYEYQVSTGKMILESKDKMKKRGLPSPDRADAFIMAASISMDELDRPDEINKELVDEEEDTETFNVQLDKQTGYPVST